MLFASTSEAHSKIYCLQLEVRHEFYFLHVNRICVTPKTFEREIYEQTAADHLSAFPLAFPQHFLSVRVGERCSGIRSMNESENQACPSLRFPQLFVFHLESWLYC